MLLRFWWLLPNLRFGVPEEKKKEETKKAKLVKIFVAGLVGNVCN